MATSFIQIIYDAHGRPIPPGPLPGAIEHYIPKAGHYDHGRTGPDNKPAVPRYIVIHNTEATDDSVNWLSWQSNPPASIHVIAEREGTRVNIVNYGDTAWQTGYSKNPVHGYNSLGIEFANASNHWGTKEEYPDRQIWTGSHAVATWCYSYGIPLTNIVRHTDIAVWPPGEAASHPPGDLRRYDPSNFPWSLFMGRVASWLDFFAALPVQWQPYFII